MDLWKNTEHTNLSCSKKNCEDRCLAILGILFSPYGIPRLSASIIEFLHVVNKGIKSI